jgi:CheY-like chemotaxis protein
LSLTPSNPPPQPAVLVVDDHRDSAESLCELLGLEGYHARPAFDAEGAQQLIGGRVWLAVVLDVQMPGRDGVDPAREWRGRLVPAPPLMIALTGRVDAEVQRPGLFDLVLQKPLDPDRLLAALRQRCEGKGSSG